MSYAQTYDFVTQWRGVGHQPDTASEFSATVFNKLNKYGIGTGQFTIVVFSSALAFTGWIAADYGDIAGQGC